MEKSIITFYNKNTNKVIGFHHPTLFVVSDVKDAFLYETDVIDIDQFLRIFANKYNSYVNTHNGVADINKKYFKNLKPTDIRYEYLDYNIILRKSKIKKLKEIIN